MDLKNDSLIILSDEEFKNRVYLNLFIFNILLNLDVKYL